MDSVEQTLAGHRTLRKYVLPGERVVLTRRSHWAKLMEPTLTTLAGFVLVAWLGDAPGRRHRHLPGRRAGPPAAHRVRTERRVVGQAFTFPGVCSPLDTAR